MIRRPPRSTQSRSSAASDVYKRQKKTLENYSLQKVIGKTSVGKQFLAKDKKTQQFVMMRIVSRQIDDIKDQAKLEKKLLKRLKHPFLLDLKESFHTTEKQVFIFEFMRGGELFQHLRKFRRFNEEKAKFYAAQLVLALEYLHSEDIIYRDLKPENIFIDNEGYIALTDYGFCLDKKIKDKLDLFLGTPEYLAPEVIAGGEYGKTSDWWNFGVVLYEMLVGLPPFFNKVQNVMFQAIVETQVKFPQQIQISEEGIDFLDKLLKKSPSERIGTIGGVAQIMDHQWFQDINWDLLLQKKLPAPFVPTSENDEDLTKFYDEEFLNEDLDDALNRPY
eukprot:TRINITY_DN19110_c0_g1_i1.p1 TRINITY_DN19110_c0_g1~~TRINITY_DN19110_c0_g1_i1.p1  ORF type:complete len:333 (+),score=60.04 TRINITY_DN19110_c0_g1_i1:13-1011(+)